MREGEGEERKEERMRERDDESEESKGRKRFAFLRREKEGREIEREVTALWGTTNGLEERRMAPMLGAATVIRKENKIKRGKRMPRAIMGQ